MSVRSEFLFSENKKDVVGVSIIRKPRGAIAKKEKKSERKNSNREKRKEIGKKESKSGKKKRNRKERKEIGKKEKK